MRGEYDLKRRQLKGYLFEIIILELLNINGFVTIKTENESEENVRETRAGFIEFKGRGCWHQIDCPCDYNKFVPFLYPIRILGEVKFYATPVQKNLIREYIGVLKDIQENYFVFGNMRDINLYPRKLNVGAYFAANGFNEEAEKLAYAHGIKTISYQNNYLIDRIKNSIQELENNYLSIKCMNTGIWKAFKTDFISAIRNNGNGQFSRLYLADGSQHVLEEISENLTAIKSSFMATSSTGVFIHFVGEHHFPSELFRESDYALCRVYYDYDNFHNKYFWLEISNDDQERKYYFTPPESLNEAAVYGGEIVLNEKERIFKVLNVSINMDGINRNLILHIDQDWLDAARKANRD